MVGSSTSVSGIKQNLVGLSSVLKRDHGDAFLSDFINEPFSAQGNRLLNSALKSNYTGSPEQAFADAVRARAAYSKAGNRAGMELSEFEIVYSWHRRSASRECLAAASMMSPGSLNYRWLEIQLEMEKSICEGMSSRFDTASKLANDAVHNSEQAHYPSLHLRALAIQSSLLSAEGNLRDAWHTDELGLEAFWAAFLPVERGFQFYSDIELNAEEAGMWHLAAIEESEALALLDTTARLDFKAMAHAHRAIALIRAGDTRQVNEELDLASSLFRRLPPSQTTRFYEAQSQIAMAEFEANEGNPESGRRRLLALSNDLVGVDNFVVQLPYEQAWASIERGLGNRKQELRHLNNAIRIGNRGFTNLKSESERWNWRRAVNDIYRRLLQTELQSTHDPVQALADWEAYRVHENYGPNIMSGSVVGNLSAKRALEKRVRKLRNSTLIGFSYFGNRVVIWIADDRGIYEQMVVADRRELESEVHQFYELCGNKDSSLEKIKELGSRLYGLLLKPVQKMLDPERVQFVEADGFMASIPWPALAEDDGRFIAERYIFASTPGILFPARRINRDILGGTVLVASPGAVDLNGVRYLPLPSAIEEAEYVAGLYPKNTILRGRETTARKLLRALRKVSSFHFAGHAITRERGGELIVENENGLGESISASTLASFNLTHMNLVVLSACSTAGGVREISRDPSGLVRGFLKAGTAKVVATRWDVDSHATTDFMHSFYIALRNHPLVPDAIDAAQMSLIKKPDTTHPHYWAAFELFGSPN